MNASPPVHPQTETPGFPGVSFGTSADGMRVARVGDTAFAMAKARDDRHYLVTAWRLGRPMGEWTRDDFYGHSGELADEAAFSARVLENAEHQREKRALGRKEICSRASTPWGASQGGTLYAELDSRPWRLSHLGRPQSEGPSFAARRGRLVRRG